MQRYSRFPEFSFVKDKPILDPGPAWEKPKCKPMDADWRQAIANKFWATNFTGDLKNEVPASTLPAQREAAVRELRELLGLRDILLPFGGEEVCLSRVEIDLGLLQQHGEIWLPKGATIKRGEVSQCHRNALSLWEADPAGLRVATGYYLTDDGMWRQHSWCIRPTAKGGRVVETTHKALLYFGVILTDQEARVRVSQPHQ